MSVEPVVTGPHTKYAGKRYKLGNHYNVHKSENNTNWKSYRVILAMFDLSQAPVDFWDLCVAVRHHKHGTKAAKGPQSFIRYLIRNDYLIEA